MASGPHSHTSQWSHHTVASTDTRHETIMSRVGPVYRGVEKGLESCARSCLRVAMCVDFKIQPFMILLITFTNYVSQRKTRGADRSRARPKYYGPGGRLITSDAAAFDELCSEHHSSYAMHLSIHVWRDRCMPAESRAAASWAAASAARARRQDQTERTLHVLHRARAKTWNRFHVL